MKTTFYNLVLIFFIGGLTVFSNNNWKGKHTEQKTIKKEYSVNNDALLKVVNSYGSINVATYTGNKIIIEVLIKTNGNDLDNVKERLDDITVDFSGTDSMVSAITNIKKRSSSKWWNWGNNNNVNIDITYTIKLPITNSVNLDNSYGSINLDTLEGTATINCDYGKITTKELMASNNSISFDYTNNTYFEYINGGKINADYSSFTVARTKSLQLEADYTKSVIEIAEDVIYNCDYGSLTINKANHIKGESDYLTIRFGNIYKTLEADADYGSIKIDELGKYIERVKIETDYVGITIGLHQEAEFIFKIDLEYASFKYPSTFEILKQNIRSTQKYYEGFVNNSKTSNTVIINSDYGSVTFK
jgi:hypothetical protein